MKAIKSLLKTMMFFVSMGGLFYSSILFADTAPAAAPAGSIGTVATTVTSSMGSIGTLITAAAYVAGMGFAVASIFKFMHYKNNPQQETIGKPITMLFVAASLLFLPSLFTAAGKTLFTTPTSQGIGGETSITGPPGQ